MKPLIIGIITLITLAESAHASIGEPDQQLVVNLEASAEPGLKFLIQVTDKRTVIVRIRNRYRDIVFEQTFHGSKAYTGTFNLKNLNNGKYFLEVRHFNQKFSKQIHLKKYFLRTVSF